MNQLQAFIYFLKRMDFVMLEEILTDETSYCGTTKALFLEKLQDIFTWNLFLENETLPVQWSKSNTNCLQFFCWKPNDYENAFLINSTKDGSIISFINKRPHFGFHNSFFRIYEDEEIGFVKSTEFIMLQNQCKNAIEEMTEVLYTTDLILNWVNQYLSIYDEIKDEDDECIYKNIKYVEEFFELWQSKSYEKDLILEYKDAELAVLEYNEIEIIDWLDKYHNLYYCVLMPSNSLADFVCDIEYKYKLGNREYQSKELYYVEKFTDLYFTSNHK
jgi:hypothetical protein